MAYTAPNANGSFAPMSGNNQTINPRLGLLSLTDPTIALEEFYTVRELNQPMSGGNSSGGSAGGSSSNPTVDVGGKRLSVGIVVLIGILSFFALCCVLFVAHWFIFRRKAVLSATDGDVFRVEKNPTTTEVLMLTKTISSKDESGSMGSFKSDLEEAALAVGVGDEKILSDSSDLGTNVAVVEDGRMMMMEALGEGGGGRESMASGDNAFVQYQQKVNNLYPAQEPEHLLLSFPPSLPPLPSQTQQSPTSSDPYNFARQSTTPSPNRETESQDDFDELFEIDDNVRTDMAGIGTASRTSKTYLDSSFLRGINMNSGIAELGDNNGPSFAFDPTRA